MSGSLGRDSRADGDLTPRLRAGYRRMLPAVALLGPLALAACGSIRAGATGATGPPGGARPVAVTGGAAPARAGLCGATSRVDRLVVRRVGGGEFRTQHFPVPIRVTVTDVARVRAVARALCAQPRIQRGVYNCPAVFPGTDYFLRFSAGDRRFRTVTVGATGCEVITGLGPVRRVTTADFWRVLGRAVGMASPGLPGFAGLPVLWCQPAAGQLHQVNGCPVHSRAGGTAG